MQHCVSQSKTLSLAVSLAFLCGCFAFISAQSPNADQKQRPRRVGDSATTTPAESANKAQTPSHEEVDDGDVVRVDTQLVSVPAVVTNNSGRPLAGLQAGNFVLFENGQPQQLANFATTEAPFEIALLLDTSGSTRADVALIRRAANAFIDELRPGDRVAIVAFNTDQKSPAIMATVEVLAKLTADRKVLRGAVQNLGSSSGTPFYDSLERISREVFSAPPSDEFRGRRAVVALTDGVDSSSESGFENARAKLLRAGVACYFIQVNTEDFVEDRLMKDCEDDGRLTLSQKQLERYRRIFVPGARPEDYESFCRLGPFEKMQISRNLYNLARREMDDLAKASGGRNFVAASLQDARAAFAQVANEIGTQYSLGYYPTNKARDGKYRAIKVEVRGVTGKPNVRAREGYMAPKQ
ncbi:MAG: VWA domain-containing protein [Pyrinomonadaceae bacterium]